MMSGQLEGGMYVMKMLPAVFFFVGLTFASTRTATPQWVEQSSGAVENLVGVVMLDPSTAIVVGHRNAILRTTDAGATWLNETAHISAIYSWNDISFHDSLDGVIVGDYRIESTADGGVTWKYIASPTTDKCISALSVGTASFSIGTDSGWVYSTSDTGNSWTSERISRWPVRSIFRWRGTDPFVGVSKYAITSRSFCTQYVVPPPSWGESVLSGFQGLGSEAFDAEFCDGGTAGFIVGVQGDLRSAPAILRKSIQDTTWQQVSTGILRDGRFLGVSAPSENVVYVCGSAGMIYRSTDGGDDWAVQSVPTTRTVNAICFFDESRGIAVGDSGLILYTSTGGVTSVRNQDDCLPVGFSLDQNYPNPFNPTTVIAFGVPGSGFVSLKVYDVLGREVATLVDGVRKPGRYNVTFDAGGLPSGVYFYRLTAGRYTSIRKALLLK